jgi:hypothetical protein
MLHPCIAAVSFDGLSRSPRIAPNQFEFWVLDCSDKEFLDSSRELSYPNGIAPQKERVNQVAPDEASGAGHESLQFADLLTITPQIEKPAATASLKHLDCFQRELVKIIFQ